MFCAKLTPGSCFTFGGPTRLLASVSTTSLTISNSTSLFASLCFVALLGGILIFVGGVLNSASPLPTTRLRSSQAWPLTSLMLLTRKLMTLGVPFVLSTRKRARSSAPLLFKLLMMDKGILPPLSKNVGKCGMTTSRKLKLLMMSISASYLLNFGIRTLSSASVLTSTNVSCPRVPKLRLHFARLVTIAVVDPTGSQTSCSRCFLVKWGVLSVRSFLRPF